MSTFAQKISQWRDFLNDEVEPYAWTDTEFAYFANDVLDEICEDCHVIEDRSNATDNDGNDLCQITLVQDQIYYPVSPKIVRIVKAKISNQSYNMYIKDLEWMENNLINWEGTDSATPQYIVEAGVGTDTIAIYPPADADSAGQTINMTVIRRPLIALSASDTSANLEVSDWVERHMDSGIYREAYAKHDEDTELQLAAKYEAKFEADKNKIKSKLQRKRHRNRGVNVSGAFS